MRETLASVYTQTAVAAPRCFISALFEKGCVYTRLTGHFLRPKHYHKHTRWEKSGRGRKLQFQLSNNVSPTHWVIVDMQRCLPLLRSTEWSLCRPVICSVTHMRSPTYTGWLFKEGHILSVSKMTALYNKIKLIRLQTVKHQLLCTQNQSSWRNIKAPNSWRICKKRSTLKSNLQGLLPLLN